MYILWKRGNSYSIKLILDSLVFKPHTAILNNSFGYKNKLKTYFIEEEGKLKFVSPIVSYYNPFIVYRNSNFIFCFEAGISQVEFSQKEDRLEARMEWSNIIEEEILSNNIKWEYESRYQRKDYSEIIK